MVQDVQNTDSSIGNRSTGAKDSSGTVLIELLVVLGGDYTTNNNHDILTAEFSQLCDDLGHQSQVTRSQRELSAGYISQLEAPGSYFCPSLKTLFKIAEVLGTTVSKLTDIED